MFSLIIAHPLFLTPTALQDIAAALTKCGFKVTLCVDTGSVLLRANAVQFEMSASDATCLVLIYFVGHGARSMSSDNAVHRYLLPADYLPPAPQPPPAMDVSAEQAAVARSLQEAKVGWAGWVECVVAVESVC
jgi:hypothetical protein